MKIHLGTLKRLIQETILAEDAPTFSTLNVKPGQVLRYTGGDMEKPPMVKVINVQGGVITAGDKHGKVHKIGEKDLHRGEYTPMN